MYFFTADEHYGHKAMLQYRPFETVSEMTHKLIDNHNSVVKKGDITVHIGDFTLAKNPEYALSIIERLNGTHVFLKGSHDYWLDPGPRKLDWLPADYLWEKTLKYPDKKRYFITCCHYPMRSWPRSHYPGSWQLFGHHHGKLPPYGLQMDVGVDTNNHLCPYSFDDIIKILEPREELYNLALQVFGEYKSTWDWLCSPAKGLGGAIPIEYVRTDLQEVKNLLGRIEYGIFT